MLATKALHRILNLFKVLRSRDSHFLIEAYEIYVCPVLETATTVFNPFKKKDIATLEGVQNSFTRKLYLRSFHVPHSEIPIWSERNKIFDLKTLALRRKRNDLLFTYKLLKGILGLDPSEFFSRTPSRTVGPSRSYFQDNHFQS